MRRTPIRAAVVAVMLAAVVAVPGAAGAVSRVPASPTVRQIVVMTTVVNATNAWLGLVIAAYPPTSCSTTEIDPVCLGFVQVLGAYGALGATVAGACEARPGDGLGDALVTDAVAPAGDLRTGRIVRQLALITAVLGYANDRLIGILSPDPGPPDAPEAAALAALYEAVVDGGSAAGAWLDPTGTSWPPNPCMPSPGPPTIGA